MAKRQRRRKQRRNTRNHPSRPTRFRPLRCEPLEDRRLLAVVTVDTVDDVVDVNDGVTSLREAIFATNLVDGPDEINFDFGIDGPATILLQQGELQITDSLTITGPGAELLTIDASGNDPTPGEHSGDGSRVFRVDDGDNEEIRAVKFQGLTITGGDSPLNGGGIYSAENLTLEKVTVFDNAMTGTRQWGGGIYQTIATLTLNSAQILENSTPNYSGGGVSIDRGALHIVESQIRGNTADLRGGGINAVESEVTVVSSTIDDNHARSGGGGIYVGQGSFLLQTSMVSNNSTTQGDGGGVSLFTESGTVRDSVVHGNSSGDSAGGLLAQTRDGLITIVQTTISGNSAANGGGIVSNALRELGSVQVVHSTVVQNDATTSRGGGIFASRGRLSIDHSIVAANTAEETGPDFFVLESTFGVPVTIDATYSIVGRNDETDLIETPVDLPDANGNLIGGAENGAIDPLLAPLADNGGRTLTHALLPGSPAINAGNLNVVAGENGVPETDQRGGRYFRVFSRIDIGAYELRQFGDMNLLVDTLVDESDGDYSRGDLSLREAIELANANPAPDTIRFDPIFPRPNGRPTIRLTEGELVITDDVEIIGLGRNELQIDGVQQSRILSIDDGSLDTRIHVSIRGLTFTGGNGEGRIGNAPAGGAILSFESLSIADSAFEHNSAGVGGAIAARGQLTVDSTRFADNRSIAFGGAIHFVDASSRSADTLDVTGSEFSRNMTNNAGGAVYAMTSHDGDTVHLSGNEFRNNRVENSDLGVGGGVYLMLRNSDSVIRDNRFERNYSASRGGAIYLRTALGDALVENNDIIRNYAREWGGGVFTSGDAANIELRGNQIIDNTTGGLGGGVFVDREETSIVGGVIRGNRAGESGGGIYHRGSVIVSGTNILDNVAEDGSGGGIHGAFDTSLELRDSQVANNSADGSQGVGGGVYFHGNSLLVQNSQIAQNTATNSGGGVYMQSVDDASFIESTVVGNRITSNEQTTGGGITLIDSLMSFEGGSVSGNAARQGGGIWSAHSMLNLHNVTMQQNSVVTRVDGETSAELRGGAIAAIDSHLEITDSRLTGNGMRATLGGALDIVGGSTSIADTLFGGNGVLITGAQPPGRGGAIAIAGDQDLATLSISGGEFLQNSAPSGGAIAVLEGAVVDVDRSVFLGNSAFLEGGGAIEVNSGGELSVYETRFANNDAEGDGGAIRSDVDTLVEIERSVFEFNHTQGSGGALHTASRLTLQSSMLRGNSAQENGGGAYIATQSGRQSLLHSNTFAFNQSDLSGGAVYVSNDNGVFDLINSTVSANSANGIGGGVYIDQDSATRRTRARLLHSTITENWNHSASVGAGVYISQGEIDVSHIIIANNFAQGGMSDLAGGEGHSVVISDSLVHTVAPNTNMTATRVLLGFDPQLQGLTPNGALELIPNSQVTLLTHALNPSSPAVDAGAPELQQGDFSLPEFDQRGAPFARVSGQRIDLGAYEVQPGPAFDGDFDGDLDTDGMDFLIWQRHAGLVSQQTKAEGDATGNGLVDENDLAVWEATYPVRRGRRVVAPSAVDGALTPQLSDLALTRHLLDARSYQPAPRSTFLAVQDDDSVDVRRETASFVSELVAPQQRADLGSDRLDAGQSEGSDDAPHSLEQASDEVFARF